MRLICMLFAVLAPLLTYSAPIRQGSIVSAGSTTNNSTTAVPFTIPTGPNSIQCNADVYVAWGNTTSAAATTSDLLIYADREKTFTVSTATRYTAILPVSGSATCRIFYLAGETITYRGDDPGGTMISSSRAYTMKSLTLTGDTGPVLTFSSVLENTIKFPGSNTMIGSNGSNELLVGNYSGNPTVRIGASSSITGNGSFSTTNGAFAQINNAFNVNSTASKPWLVSDPDGAKVDAATLGTCNSGVEWAYKPMTGTGASTGTAGKFCMCLSDGAGTYAWTDLVGGAAC